MPRQNRRAMPGSLRRRQMVLVGGPLDLRRNGLFICALSPVVQSPFDRFNERRGRRHAEEEFIEQSWRSVEHSEKHGSIGSAVNMFDVG
jgi:hypothetical protein